MVESSASRRRITPATIVLALAALLAVAAIIVALTRGDGAAPQANGAAPAQNGMSLDQAIAAMRRELESNPDNHEGWARLALAYRDSGQEREAEAAFRRATELQPNNPTYLAYLAESMLVIDPASRRQEVEQLFQRVLRLRPNDPQVRYYQATLKDIDGDHRGAVNDLIALLSEAPAGAPWEAQVRSAAELIAQRNNIDIAGRLPAPRPNSPATAAIPGPTREQMDAARGMAPGQQEEMVKGMVDRLAARLQQNPRDENGWMMLMRSRMVRGEGEQAAAALRSALGAFQNDAAAQQRLRTAAAELGIPAG